MKTLILRNLFLAVFMLAGLASFAQIEYYKHDTIEDILIEYRWQRASIFRKDADARLNLKISNHSYDYVEVRFTVAFYRDEQIYFESSEQVLCLAPGASRRGARAGLRFSAPGITRDAITEDWFSWDLSGVKVKVIDGCD